MPFTTSTILLNAIESVLKQHVLTALLESVTNYRYS